MEKISEATDKFTCILASVFSPCINSENHRVVCHHLLLLTGASWPQLSYMGAFFMEYILRWTSLWKIKGANNNIKDG